MKTNTPCTDEEMFALMSDIRQNTPMLSNEEKTLENIISRLPDNVSQKQNTPLKWLKTIVNAAAIFLICLLVFQQTDDTIKMKKIAQTETQISTINILTNNTCNYTTEYVKKYPKEALVCYMKNNARKPLNRKQFNK